MILHNSKRTMFFISDSTGITVEALGLCLISHFEGFTCRHVRLPFIDTEEKAKEAIALINAAQAKDRVRSILCMTIVNPTIRAMFQLTGGLCLDMFGTFVNHWLPNWYAASADHRYVAPCGRSTNTVTVSRPSIFLGMTTHPKPFCKMPR